LGIKVLEAKKRRFKTEERGALDCTNDDYSFSLRKSSSNALEEISDPNP